jgi:hypothetical protein
LYLEDGPCKQSVDIFLAPSQLGRGFYPHLGHLFGYFLRASEVPILD